MVSGPVRRIAFAAAREPGAGQPQTATLSWTVMGPERRLGEVGSRRRLGVVVHVGLPFLGALCLAMSPGFRRAGGLIDEVTLGSLGLVSGSGHFSARPVGGRSRWTR